MLLRPIVDFDADFDAEPLNPDEGLVAPRGGGAVMQLFASRLRAHGFQVAEPEVGSSYGWEFTASKARTSVWCMLQIADRWLLMTEKDVGLFKRLFGKKAADDDAVHVELCKVIHAVLSEDERLHASRTTVARGRAR
jgi:hypothetical protein